MRVLMRHVYTYEELARSKIERELRAAYIVETKKAKTFTKSSKVLMAKLPKLADAWEQETNIL
jgi:hypothetical protein